MARTGRKAPLLGGLYAFASADGLHWQKRAAAPAMTQGAFDSLNLAFWDGARRRYANDRRIFIQKVRAVQSAPSADSRHWTEGEPNRDAPAAPWEHFYTSATLLCPEDEHLLLAFPKRFIPSRKKYPRASFSGNLGCGIHDRPRRG